MRRGERAIRTESICRTTISKSFAIGHRVQGAVVKYLLDTSIVSETRKPRPKSTTLERLGRHIGVSAICAPVWQEVLYGCERLPRGKRRDDLEDHLTNVVRQFFPILPYDEAAASFHASERARLERRGKTPAFVDRHWRSPSAIDGQIASIAAVRDLTLVTMNVEHFEPFDVRVERW